VGEHLGSGDMATIIMPDITIGHRGGNMNNVGIYASPLVKPEGTNRVITMERPNRITMRFDQYTVDYWGVGLTLTRGVPSSGYIRSYSYIHDDGTVIASLDNFSPELSRLIYFPDLYFSTESNAAALQERYLTYDDVIDASLREGAVTLLGYAGSDRITGGNNNDYLNGGFGVEKDYLFGGAGDDFLGGGGGPDILYGMEGDDEIRGGHGKDTISGGGGIDRLYGGGGANYFISEEDRARDVFFIQSDFRAHEFDWGRNHGGVNADIIEEMDTGDKIIILGTSTDRLSFVEIADGSRYSQPVGGIGIFDGASLEALYIGDNLNLNQLRAQTLGDSTRFW